MVYLEALFIRRSKLGHIHLGINQLEYDNVRLIQLANFLIVKTLINNIGTIAMYHYMICTTRFSVVG